MGTVITSSDDAPCMLKRREEKGREEREGKRGEVKRGEERRGWRGGGKGEKGWGERNGGEEKGREKRGGEGGGGRGEGKRGGKERPGVHQKLYGKVMRRTNSGESRACISVEPLRAFALLVSLAWNALPQIPTWLPRLLQGFGKTSASL